MSNVTISDAESLRGELDDYIDDFRSCIKTKPSQRHLKTYLSGLISGIERKTAEAIAFAFGEAPRTILEFLGQHRWDEDSVSQRIIHRVRDLHHRDGGIGVIDETGIPKSGSETVGIGRQYCGRSGKVDNCVVSTGLGYVHEDFYCLLDADQYLPEQTWGTDKEIRKKAKIPKDVVYRPKWVIGIELIQNAVSEGMTFDWITADELYGRCAGFRNSVADLGPKYVVEIPTNLTGWTTPPAVEPEGFVTKSGRTLKKARVASGEKEARRVDELWNRGGPSWQLYHVKNTTKGPQVWEARESRFHPREDGVPGPESRLIIARNVLTKEVKYFLSNAADDTPIGTILYVAFCRWYIEHIFKESKSRVGYDHFEVRNYLAVKRHLILSRMSLLYLVEQKLRLREKSPLWTVPQVTKAIEVQLDDEMSKTERRRKLVKEVRRINYYQKKYKQTSQSHHKTQLRKLHEAGIDLESAIRCIPPWKNLAEYN